MIAEQVIEGLRRRHQALDADGAPFGGWTVLEEFERVDVLAIAAWEHPPPNIYEPVEVTTWADADPRYVNGYPIAWPIIAYEVKVSRSDLFSESAHKHDWALAHSHAFYFATPPGLLRPEDRLLIPAGLVEVPEGGEPVVVREAPVRPNPEPIEVGRVARWASARPDPRHQLTRAPIAAEDWGAGPSNERTFPESSGAWRGIE